MRYTATPQRKLSKAELVDVLKGKLDEWIKGGCTPEEAVEKLTIKQYDFLIDQGVDLDNYLLTPEQIQNTRTVKRAPRRLSPDGYNKKYPKSKQELYNGIVEYLQTQGAEIIPRDKCNYRDIDFMLNGVHHKIVLSNPRT